MTYAREKRLLLGAAALVVAWPLPFNQVLEWPVLALFLAVVVGLLRRAARGSEEWLSARALNLLGLAYLPVLVVDLAATGRVQLVRPVLHLTLFGLGAKLWSLERERDKWQAWIGIFFLFLAAMSTSTHPSVVVYLILFLALSVALLVRFVHLHVLSSFGARDAPAGELGAGRFVTAVVAATVLLAAPLFALLPRVRTPYVFGPGGTGVDPSIARAGFSDEMSLDLIGRIRDNPEIALRIRFEGQHGSPALVRLKASVYDRWDGRAWRQVRGGRLGRRDPGSGLYRFTDAPVRGRARILLEPLRSRSLVLPTETVALAIETTAIAIDDGGALLLTGQRTEPIEYEALLGAGGRSLARPPGRVAASDADPLEESGVTDRMRELAASWAGSGDVARRAQRIERRLLEDYRYSTVLLGRGGESPIESFLFETRRGHCEYFASAMVLLLRAQAIPARLVTGFYGAEWSAWEGAWVVRQSNAHAWVEAWVPGEGWRGFDPTPPDGRPLATPTSFRHYLRQGWESVVFRWDRWVISYDFDDQVSVLGSLRQLWDRLWDDLFARDRPRSERAADTARNAEGAPFGALQDERVLRGRWIAAAIAALAAAIGAFWYWRQHRPVWTATRVYERLRLAMRAAGLAIPESLAPLALARLAAERLPGAAEPAARVVDGYLREAFAGEQPPAAAVEALRHELDRVEHAGRRRKPR